MAIFRKSSYYEKDMSYEGLFFSNPRFQYNLVKGLSNVATNNGSQVFTSHLLLMRKDYIMNIKNWEIRVIAALVMGRGPTKFS